jgi:hypothetical protein
LGLLGRWKTEGAIRNLLPAAAGMPTLRTARSVRAAMRGSVG